MSETYSSDWNKIQGILGGQVSQDTMERWFSHIGIAQLDDSIIVLEAPNQIYQFWIETNYLPQLMDAIEIVIGSRRKIAFKFRETDPLAPASEKAALESSVSPVKKRVRKRGKPAAEEIAASELGLNHRYVFESFVVGSNNEFAHAACQAVAQSPGRTYNPLFIYGGTGLGKTHLMHAIGHAILKERPRAKVVYITSEQFTNQFIEAISDGSLVKFRQRYREADVLLIDDIHFLAKKEKSQEEFFHTFNTLCDSHGKQIVMTSDMPAGKIKHLEKRLVTRFEWGLTAELTAPDTETRIAILKKKAKEWKVRLGRDVLEFVAQRIRNNVRRLEGALIRLASYRTMHAEADLDIKSVQRLLQDFLNDETREVTIPDIQKHVAEYYDVRVSDLLGRKRPAQIALARQVAMYFSRELTGASYQDIGDAFGGRDHGTAMHACRTVNAKCEKIEKIRKQVDALYGELTDSPGR